MQGFNIHRIREEIDRGFAPLLRHIEKRYAFTTLSPFTFYQAREFGLRRGNRVRSVLLLLSYLGYSGKRLTPELCRWASSLELIQNFILIHDDIIDNASLRRGGPALHISLNRKLARRGSDKTGRDIAMVVGDIFFSTGIDLFVTIKEKPQRTARALAELMHAAVETGCGEINELMLDMGHIDRVERADIFRTYDLKTARYTFITPLRLGAILGGAPKADIETLDHIGRLCGRAFQIRDDLGELLSPEHAVQKTFLADFKASKKTILLWYFFQKAAAPERRLCCEIFASKRKKRRDLQTVRTLFLSHGVAAAAEHEIRRMVRAALQATRKLAALPAAKSALEEIIRMIEVPGKKE